MFLPLVLTLAAAAPPIDVALLPPAGLASPKLRVEAAKVVKTALGALEGVTVHVLDRLPELLGAEASARLESCVDDACFRSATKTIRSDALIVCRLDGTSDRLFVGLRSIDTSTRGAIVATRISREVRDASALDGVIADAAVELFPEHAAQSLGTIVLMGELPAELQVELDGITESPVVADLAGRLVLRARPGAHSISVRAPKHVAFEAEVLVRPGRSTTLEVDLDRRRSKMPYFLAGGGVAAAGMGLLLGQLARHTAREWSEACESGRCEPGFTRSRYEEDASRTDRYRLSANALFVASSVALVLGVITFITDPGLEVRSP